jgi:hypothetical protein
MKTGRCLLAAAALVIILPLICGAVKIPELEDVSGHWAEEYIAEAAERGIVSGYSDGMFYPSKPVTRAEYIKMTVLAFSVGERTDPKDTAPMNFEDISEHWAKPYIQVAFQAKLIIGTKNKRILPDEPISRQDAILILSRVEELLGMPVAETRPDDPFLDKDYIRADCADAVAHFRRAGIITGKTGNMFDPIGNMTRAEAVKCIISTLRAVETPANSTNQQKNVGGPG